MAHFFARVSSRLGGGGGKANTNTNSKGHQRAGRKGGLSALRTNKHPEPTSSGTAQASPSSDRSLAPSAQVSVGNAQAKRRTIRFTRRGHANGRPADVPEVSANANAVTASPSEETGYGNPFAFSRTTPTVTHSHTLQVRQQPRGNPPIHSYYAGVGVPEDHDDDDEEVVSVVSDEGAPPQLHLKVLQDGERSPAQTWGLSHTGAHEEHNSVPFRPFFPTGRYEDSAPPLSIERNDFTSASAADHAIVDDEDYHADADECVAEERPVAVEEAQAAREKARARVPSAAAVLAAAAVARHRALEVSTTSAPPNEKGYRVGLHGTPLSPEQLVSAPLKTIAPVEHSVPAPDPPMYMSGSHHNIYSSVDSRSSGKDNGTAWEGRGEYLHDREEDLAPTLGKSTSSRQFVGRTRLPRSSSAAPAAGDWRAMPRSSSAAVTKAGAAGGAQPTTAAAALRPVRRRMDRTGSSRRRGGQASDEVAQPVSNSAPVPVTQATVGRRESGTMLARPASAMFASGTRKGDQNRTGGSPSTEVLRQRRIARSSSVGVTPTANWDGHVLLSGSGVRATAGLTEEEMKELTAAELRKKKEQERIERAKLESYKLDPSHPDYRKRRRTAAVDLYAAFRDEVPANSDVLGTTPKPENGGQKLRFGKRWSQKANI